MSLNERADDFPPDLVSDDEAIDLVIDDVLMGSKQLRRLTKKILKAQRRLQPHEHAVGLAAGAMPRDPNVSYLIIYEQFE